MKILIATTSTDKLNEMENILSPEGFEIKYLSDFKPLPEPIEDGKTFMENSVIKSVYYSQNIDMLTIADDSGIEIDFLNGEPGVYSARFGGISASGEQKNNIILKKLKGVSIINRGANYTCAVSVAKNGSILKKIEEKCYGIITEKPSGTGGFGYDPVFFFPPFGKTFAEVPLEMKNKVSHRGKALSSLLSYLVRLKENFKTSRL